MTGIIRLTGLTLLTGGAEDDFSVDAGEDAKDFGVDTGEIDFGVDTGEEANEDFGSDVREDVGADFGAGSGENGSAGSGRGVNSDTCGNGSRHLSGTRVEDKSRCSLSLSLTRRGLDARGAEDEGADFDGNIMGNLGEGAGEDVWGDFGAGVGGDVGATSGGFCGGAGVSKNKASQSCGKAIIY